MLSSSTIRFEDAAYTANATSNVLGKIDGLNRLPLELKEAKLSVEEK